MVADGGASECGWCCSFSWMRTSAFVVVLKVGLVVAHGRGGRVALCLAMRIVIVVVVVLMVAVIAVLCASCGH